MNKAKVITDKVYKLTSAFRIIINYVPVLLRAPAQPKALALQILHSIRNTKRNWE